MGKLQIKYLAILFLVLILISGCSHYPSTDGEKNNIVDKEETEIIYGEPDEKPKEVVQTPNKLYILKKGESVTVDNIIIRVLEFSYDEKLSLEIGGEVRQLEETKEEMIVQGLVIILDAFDFETGKIGLIIEPLVLGANEYFFKQGGNVKVGSSVFTLDKILTDDLKQIEVKVFAYDTQYAERIKEGATKDVGSLRVTNIKTNPRGITLEKYSVVRIEQK